MTMALTALTPLLCTSDLAASLAFHTSVPGFRCTARNDEIGWASLERDAVTILFGAPNAHQGDVRPAFSGSRYLRCAALAEVEALWLQLKGRCKCCYPPEDFFYGMREFAIYDNNGYLLQCGAEV
jgi:uncharacterized glyoxalase superfamily protein PhnB